MSAQTANSSGIGFWGLLQIAFIVLKLIGKIDWSWWWVLAPTWGPLLIVLALVLWYIVELMRFCNRRDD